MVFCRFSDTYYVDQLYTEKKFGWSVSQYTDCLAFYVLMVVFRTFITTPFFCYYLGMHDCMAAIAGILVNENRILVTVSIREQTQRVILKFKIFPQLPFGNTPHYILLSILSDD